MTNIKVLLLSDINTSHTLKWVTALRKENVSVEVFSLASPKPTLQESLKDIPIFCETFDHSYFTKDETNLKKLFYLKSFFRLKQLIKKRKPAILHAHYASSYGLLGAIVGFRPFIVSVWGSDVFDFPKKSFIHKVIIKYIFRKADKILSTSNIMAMETNRYTQKKIEVTSFGVDTEKFRPGKYKNLFSKEAIVTGTVKALEKKYGIVYLLKSFAIVKTKHPDLLMKLLIVGGGTEEKQLKELAVRLKIESDTIFTGKSIMTK